MKQDDTGESRNPYKSSLGEQQTLGAQGIKNCQGEGRGFESRRPLQKLPSGAVFLISGREPTSRIWA